MTEMAEVLSLRRQLAEMAAHKVTLEAQFVVLIRSEAAKSALKEFKDSVDQHWQARCEADTMRMQSHILSLFDFFEDNSVIDFENSFSTETFLSSPMSSQNSFSTEWCRKRCLDLPGVYL